MKLIDRTRSTSPSVSNAWTCAIRCSVASSNGAADVNAARQASLACAGASARYGADQAVDRGLQWLVEIAAIPDQPETSVGVQHARELPQGGRVREPVERLPGDDAVDRCRLQRERLGLGGADIGQWRRALERRAHPGDRLDGDDPQPALEQWAGQLAGARADVEHARTGPCGEPELRDEPVHRGRRVFGAPALIALAGSVEAARGGMQVHRRDDLTTRGRRSSRGALGRGRQTRSERHGQIDARRSLVLAGSNADMEGTRALHCRRSTTLRPNPVW